MSDIFDRPTIKHISYIILKRNEIKQCNCSLYSNKTGFTNVICKGWLSMDTWMVSL
jgi:hypothetical protein